MTSLHVSPGALVLSCDLPAACQSRPIAALKDTLQIISGAGFSATWFAADPARSADVEHILSTSPIQEIGLSGERSWSTKSASRSVFHAELSRRVTCAAAAGYSLSTLALPEYDLLTHPDLAIKQGIEVARINLPKPSSSLLTRALGHVLQSQSPSAAVPRLARYGLWQVPTSLCFPEPGASSLAGATRRAIRGIESAQHGYFHLVVDLTSPNLSSSGALKSLESVLEAAQKRRDAHRLTVCNINQMVEQVAQAHRSIPARSILRERAA